VLQMIKRNNDIDGLLAELQAGSNCTSIYGKSRVDASVCRLS
jgi:hypothetical protein